MLRSRSGRPFPLSRNFASRVAIRRIGWLVAPFTVLGVAACEVDKKSLSAPSDAVIRLSLAETFLVVNMSARLTVQVQTLNGSAVQDGTEVRLGVEGGSVDQQKVRTLNGTAIVMYRASAEPGTARITAYSGAAMSDLPVIVISAAAKKIKITADPPILPAEGGESEVVATVVSKDGKPVAGLPVAFEASQGEMSQTTVVTDANGQAKTILRTQSNATVRASASGLPSAEASVKVRAVLSLNASASPTRPMAGEAVAVTVAATGSDGQSVSGVLSINFGDGKSTTIGDFRSTATTLHTYSREGTYTITARLETPEGSSATTTLSLTVKPRPTLTVTMSASPSTPTTSEVVTFTVTATSSDGRAPTGVVTLDFGDGKNTTLSDFRSKGTALHAYSEAGSYTITARLDTPEGLSSSATTKVFVTDKPKATITVTISASPAKPVTNDVVTFTVTATASDNHVPTGVLALDFGNGSSSTVTFRNPTTAAQTYRQAGTYRVTATVTEPDGPMGQANLTLVIEDDDTGGGGDDDIDLRQVTFLHADVSDWKVTSTITDVDIRNPPLCIEHTKAGKWPVVEGTEGNPWVFAKIDGRWYAATYEWLAPGQACKIAVKTDTIGPLTKKSPLENWRPKSGEEIGLMVSTPARSSLRSAVQERSNVVLVRWP